MSFLFTIQLALIVFQVFFLAAILLFLVYCHDQDEKKISTE